MANNGQFEIEKKGEVPKRITMVLWGSAGVGKTTFAATAPGSKLWLSLGDNEHASVVDRDDVEVMPLFKYDRDTVLEQGRNKDNPFNLNRVLREREYIETVVFDSVTALSDMALRKAVDMGLRTGKVPPTIEQPGWTAYGGRNAIVLEVLTNLLNVTAKHGVHLIITAHEADPEKNDAGDIQYFTIMLGGKLVNNVAWRISEFWYMSEDGRGRQLAVRPTRKRKPMKSRMFRGIGEPEFILDYDADRPDKGQMTIASFYDRWADTGTKLAIPLSRREKNEQGAKD